MDDTPINPSYKQADAPPRKALVILSGGQDSTTCAFWAKKHFDEVHCITFNYGQRHALEINSARTIAKIIGAASHEVLDIGPILNGRSPLTNPNEQLEQYENFEQMDATIGNRIELTFVPMRNSLFLTLAANRAACLDITAIITGVCEADNANYPDCRGVFLDAQEKAINSALGLYEAGRKPIRLLAPLLTYSKAETVALALELSTGATGDLEYDADAFAALAFTHTAYDGQYPPAGKDHATVLRAKGFEDASMPDPLVLRAWLDDLMELPVTANYSNSKALDHWCRRIHALAQKYHLTDL